ncbi:MAG: hypothetical protein GXO90_08430 [FCB group bacterium]|nr:hypothetical protein [FCB group bacterium]
MRTINKYILLSIIFSMTLYAQDEVNQVQQTEKARLELGQTQKMEGEVVLGVGETGLRFEEPTGVYKKVVDLWAKAGIDFKEQFETYQFPEERRQEISDAFRAFLSNSPVFFVAEMDKERLKSIGDEFTLVELGGAEFTQAKQAGKWAGIDYLVKIDAVQSSEGGRLVEAKMINLDTREEYTAVTAQIGEIVNNVDIARRLAHNLEDVYLAKSEEQRLLIQKIQRAETNAMSVSKDTQLMIKVAMVGYSTSAVVGIMKGGFSGWLFGPIISVPIVYFAGVKGMAMVKKAYNDALDQYDTLINEYNSKYGEKYIDYYR